MLAVALCSLALSGGYACARAQNTNPPQANPPQSNQKTSPATSDAEKKPSTAQDNPFPEDISKKAAAAAKATADPDAPVPSAGSSSRDGLDKGDTGDSSRKKLKLEAPEGGDEPYDPKLAAEDIRVGGFYMKSGDYKGAYGRFKEAAAVNPEDPQAVWGLAEAAQKLNMQQEAAQNYQVYLDAFPDGPKAKAARKALAELKVRQ